MLEWGIKQVNKGDQPPPPRPALSIYSTVLELFSPGPAPTSFPSREKPWERGCIFPLLHSVVPREWAWESAGCPFLQLFNNHQGIFESIRTGHTKIHRLYEKIMPCHRTHRQLLKILDPAKTNDLPVIWDIDSRSACLLIALPNIYCLILHFMPRSPTHAREINAIKKRKKKNRLSRANITN